MAKASRDEVGAINLINKLQEEFDMATLEKKKKYQVDGSAWRAEAMLKNMKPEKGPGWA